jgi:two-component system LytT family response regulator
MQGRARFAWQEETGRIRVSPARRWLPAGSTRAPGRTFPAEPADSHKPEHSRLSARPKQLAQQKLDGLLEGFCPEPCQEEQIAVNSNGLILFLQLADVEWVEAADDCVELHVGQQTHRLRGTLAAVAARLPPDRFLRASRSTLVNLEQIKELQPLLHGGYSVLLRNGTRLILI